MHLRRGHKLGADRQPDFTIRKTDRYRVAEAIEGIPTGDPRWSLDWACTHLLLLTATPHKRQRKGQSLRPLVQKPASALRMPPRIQVCASSPT